MILEDETKEAFGHLLRDLTHGSRKHIIAACELCGEFRIVERHNYCIFCASCAHKGAYLTEETKRRLGEARKGKHHNTKTKAKIGAANKCNIYALGYKHSEEEKILMRKNHADYKGKKHPRWNGGTKAAGARNDAKRKRDLGYSLLMPLAEGEVGHHVTDEYVIGVPAEVHNSIGGRRKKHRMLVLQWLKTHDKKKYTKVLCVLAKQ